MSTFKEIFNFEKAKEKTNNRKYKNSINRVTFIYAIIILIFIYIMFFMIMWYNKNKEYISIDVSNMSIKNKMSAVDLSSINEFYTVKSIPKDDAAISGVMFIPNTKEAELNKYIQINIDKYISDFYKQIKGKNLKEYKYSLDILFDTYIGQKDKYISFVFYISMDTGWVHPNSYIWSIVYDFKNKEIIDIDSIAKKYPNFLVNLSDYAYKYLFKDQGIKDNGAIDILKEGTKPTKENFKTLVIDNDKLIVFFEKYKVAPYVLGEFKVEIPVKEILK